MIIQADERDYTTILKAELLGVLGRITFRSAYSHHFASKGPNAGENSSFLLLRWGSPAKQWCKNCSKLSCVYSIPNFLVKFIKQQQQHITMVMDFYFSFMNRIPIQKQSHTAARFDRLFCRKRPSIQLIRRTCFYLQSYFSKDNFGWNDAHNDVDNK